MCLVLNKSTQQQLKLLSTWSRQSSMAAATAGVTNYWSSSNHQVTSSAASSSLSTPSSTSSSSLPSSTKVLICGGGLFGMSIAYHLGQLGYKNVVLVTRNVIGSGSSQFSSGIVRTINRSPTETIFSKYSSNLYKKLQEQGHNLKYQRVGSIGLAASRDRWHTIKRLLSETKIQRVDCSLLSAEECHEKFPYMRIDDIEGGLWVPEDGIISPVDLLNTLASEAKKHGIQIVENCEVTKVLVKPTRGGQYFKVKGVETTQGDVECEIFVNCAGIRARELGKLSNPRVKVQVHSCEHHNLILKPFGIAPNSPVVHDFDGRIYMRYYEGGGLLFGGFEREGKPIFHENTPRDFDNTSLKIDLDHFYPQIKSFIDRVPSSVEVEVDKVVNGAESFTPDACMIMGESAEIDDYFVAAGANANASSLAGGVGRYTAELIAFGETDARLWPIDTRRFAKLHSNRKFLRDRVRETVGKTYSLKYPTYGMSIYRSGRKLRTSCLYTRLLSEGAVYGELLGYERPLWFDKSIKTFFFEDHAKGTFGKPPWFEKVRDEYMACRKGVALMDMSSFTKFELKSAGREVVDFLQNICSNDIDCPVGHVVHTGMQNHKGGYENDCSVVQIEPNNFMIISPAMQQTRNMKWLSEHFPEDGSVLMSDVTSMYTAINVVGPKAVELLSELTDESLSKTDFPQFTCKEIDIGYASGIKAMRLTHTGEDGFNLYVPTEYSLHVYDILMEKGRMFGLVNAGYFALRTLRIEKMFAFWGQDLDKNTNPYECIRDFRVKLESKDFIGKMALMQLRDQRLKKRFVQFLLEDHDLYQDPWPWGNEPIYRNDKYCGHTTSTCYGYSLEKQVCLGFVHNFDEKTGEKLPLTMEYLTKNAYYEIDIAGKRYKAKINIFPPNIK